MSKKFKYKNGFEGTVSDAAAALLEKKGAGKIVGTAPDAKPISEENRAKIISKIVKAGFKTEEEAKALADADLLKIVKEVR